MKGYYIPDSDLYEYFDRWYERRGIKLGDDYDGQFEKWLEAYASEEDIHYDYEVDKYYVVGER